MGYCAPALGYVDFRLGGVGIGWMKSVWLFNFGFDKGRFKKKKLWNFQNWPASTLHYSGKLLLIVMY